MTLSLSAEQRQAINTHAECAYPNECCGLLLGKTGPDCKVLVQVWPTSNTWNAQVAEDLDADPSLSKSRRYWIAPEELLQAMRHARSQELDVIGIYHSHPDHSAVPSECDRQLAWPQYSYLIVSVQQGMATDCLSWSLDDNHQFQPELLQVVETVPSWP